MDWFKEHTEQVSKMRAKLELQFESMGLIAYGFAENKVVLVSANGDVLVIEGFFYPEGPFMEVNGEQLFMLTD